MPTSSTATDNTISNTASGAPAALTDQLIMERGTTGYKLLVSDIAKAVVELYSGSSLAGASQSVKAALDSLNSRTSAYLLSSSENLLTVVLDDTILPPRSQKLFDLRNANNTDLPEAGAVYGMAVAIKRTSGNCNVMIYGDAGTIWHNSHASNQSWKGWSEL